MLENNFLLVFNFIIGLLLKFQVITNNKELITQLYFKNDVPPSYEDYVRGRETQFPSKITTNRSGRKIVFNIVMDS